MVRELQRRGRRWRGFYDYPTEKGAKKFCGRSSKPLFEKAEAQWNIDDLKDRLLYRQAVETARVLRRKRADHGA